MVIRRACVLTNGCPENRIDCARVREYLRENGWLIVDDHKTADLILFDTCALTAEQTKSSLDIIRKLQQEKREGSQLIVWGCLPKIDPEALRQAYDGPTFGESELAVLDHMIEASIPIDSVTANCLLPLCIATRQNGWRPILGLPKQLVLRWDRHLSTNAHISRQDDSSFFYIKASTGCLGNCSYCAIRKSRGRIRSKNLENIIEEFREGLNKGYKRISLLGTDLGWQGMDKGYTLVDLLRQMIEEKGDYKIGLRNINPIILNRMLGELEPIFSSNRIWYLGAAAESGSDRILKLMRRGYTAQEFKKSIATLRRVSPKLVIRTQIMVGFPTETDEDFQQSMRLIDETKFDFVEVYPFSARPGTPAAELEGELPQEVIRERYHQMNKKVLLRSTARWIERLVKQSHSQWG